MVAPARWARYGRPVRRRVALPLVLLAVLVGAPPAAAATRDPAIRFLPANAANYHHARRSASAIRLVVVHTIEGTYSGAISWFRNPRAHASANYVVARDGRITEMVAPWDVAWHAGNAWVNAHSLGIEHEGYTHVPWLYTDAEYRASARLVAALLRRSHLRADRGHVIGHSEVPDPYHREQFGGYSHHTDPGRFWDWRRYMTYLRSYLAGTAPPPLAFDAVVSAPTLMQRVKDVVTWKVGVAGSPPARLDFLVDGAPVASSTSEPWELPWDSYAASNGKHVLTAHAVATDGRVVDANVIVVVRNVRIAITDSTVGGGDILSGLVRWAVTLRGRPDRVEFVIDGSVRATVTESPYVFDSWDTSIEQEGLHVLTVRAIRGEKTVASSTYPVVVTR